MNLGNLTTIAINAARSAGQIIHSHADRHVAVLDKQTGTSQASQVVTAVDYASEKLILDQLLPTCEEYDLGLLSEETIDDVSRFDKDYFWCIDPMDGTLAFINGQPGYAVSIALVAKDGTPFIGVVYDPSSSKIYHAIKGHGAFKNNLPWQIKNTSNHLTYVTDRRLRDTPRKDEISALLKEKANKLDVHDILEVAGGGSVINAIRVLENKPACMLKFPKEEEGGGCLWDYAATACIFHELGLPATTYQGDRLDLNRKASSFMNNDGVYFASY